MERIRVLAMSNRLGGYGGTGRTLWLMLKYLSKERFDGRAYSIDGLEGDNIQGFSQHDIPLYHEEALSDVLSSFKPHICHIHRAGWPEPGPIETIKSCGVPIIIETNVFGREDSSPSGAQIDCRLFISYHGMRRYQEWTGHPLVSDRHKVLYYPIDLEDIEGFDFTRDYTTPTIGRFSRPDDLKWNPICIEMLPLLKQLVPNVNYKIAGISPNIRKKIEELQLEDSIEELPMTSDRAQLMEYLKSFHVFTHGSQIGESFGLVIAEAMAAKLPVITHPSHGGRDNAQIELVDHGVTGFVVDTPENYARSIAFLLQNPEQAKKMGEAGHAKVKNCYDANKIVSGLEEIYEYFYNKKVPH